MDKDKEKHKTYQKAWYKANKKRIKAQHNAWRDANREKRRAYSKIYYNAHSKERKAYAKTYREANKDKVEDYRQTHRKEKAVCYRNWTKVNINKLRDYWRESSRKRRALKYGTQVEPINEKIVYSRDGWICQICHKKVDKRFKHPNSKSASLDHIVPLSKGGAHIYANVQLAHLECNLNKCVSILPQGEQMRIF